MSDVDDIDGVLGASVRGMPAPEAGRRSPFAVSAVAALMHPRHRHLARVRWHPDLKRLAVGWHIIQAPLPQGNDNCWLAATDTRQKAIAAGIQIYSGREFYIVHGEETQEGEGGESRWDIVDGQARLGDEKPGYFRMAQEPELIRP